MSSTARLSIDERLLLTDAVEKQRPDLISLLESIGKDSISTREREDLRDALSSELCEAGLQEDGEPNKRGVQLDRLIGRLGAF